MTDTFSSLSANIQACRLCADRFRATATAHDPRPVFWLGQGASILIAGQAPGARVHQSGRPFDDPSGDRLLDWMGIGREVFYDRTHISVLPMAFCFPGYDAKGSDLPPPRVCGDTWHEKVMQAVPRPKLTLLVGGYAHRWHLGTKLTVTETVRGWRDHAPGVFPLPHPSWRNTAWLKRHPWFETDLLPELRQAVSVTLGAKGPIE
jgi:uracil-DNA glycosylase